MKRSIGKMIQEFTQHWKHYVIQSFLATLVFFALLLYLSVGSDAVIIASIGATAFIVFAMPNSIAASPRNVIGGHLVGLACGFVASMSLYGSYEEHLLLYSLVYAAAVGLSMFIMVVIDTEHPPAAGTALGIAISGFSLDVLIAVLVGAVVLSLIHHFLKADLKDLT